MIHTSVARYPFEGGAVTIRVSMEHPLPAERFHLFNDINDAAVALAARLETLAVEVAP